MAELCRPVLGTNNKKAKPALLENVHTNGNRLPHRQTSNGQAQVELLPESLDAIKC